MKESNIEDLASHDGPESCAGSREGVSEALTGERAGSREGVSEALTGERAGRDIELRAKLPGNTVQRLLLV